MIQLYPVRTEQSNCIVPSAGIGPVSAVSAGGSCMCPPPEVLLNYYSLIIRIVISSGQAVFCSGGKTIKDFTSEAKLRLSPIVYC